MCELTKEIITERDQLRDQIAEAREQIAEYETLIAAASWAEFYVDAKSYKCAWDKLDKCWVRYTEPDDDNETGDVSKFYTLLDAYDELKAGKQ